MKQREIKFRAFDDSKMFYSKDMETSFDGDGPYNVLRQFFDFIREDAVVMEFTGLLDKNGKEIYEFDILKSNAGRIGQVVYEFGSFQYLGDPLCYDFEDGCSITETTEWAEIIGNVHQNPDLLK